MNIFQHEHLLATIVLLILRMSISSGTCLFVENFHVNNLVLKIFHAFNFRGARKLFNFEHFPIYGTSILLHGKS